MEARKGLGPVWHCFEGHDQPPIGLQPPGQRFNGPTPKRETPQFARDASLACRTPVNPSPSNPISTTHVRICTKVNKATSSIAQRRLEAVLNTRYLVVFHMHNVAIKRG